MSNGNTDEIASALEIWKTSQGQFFDWPAAAFVISRLHKQLKELDVITAPSLATRALERLDGYKKKDVSRLNYAIRHELKAAKQRDPFTVLVPMWIDKGDAPDEIRWLCPDRALQRLSWDDVKREAPGSELALAEYEDVRRNKRLGQGYSDPPWPETVAYVIPRVYARDMQHAANAVYGDLMAWRGLYEAFSPTRRVLPFSQARRRVSIARVPPPAFIGVIPVAQDNEPLNLYPEVPGTRRCDIKTNVLEDVRKWLEEVALDNKLERYFTRVMSRYCTAFDAATNTERFLWFWQVLEAATLAHEGDCRTKQIAHRTSLLLEGDSFAKALTIALADLRNALVHSGGYEGDKVTNSLFGTFATYVARAALQLGAELKTTQRIDLYFRFAARRDIQEVDKVITYIRESTKD